MDQHTTSVECPDGRTRPFHTRTVVWHGNFTESWADGYVYAEGHRVYGRAKKLGDTGALGERHLLFTPAAGSKHRELVLSPVAPSDGIEAEDRAAAVEEAVDALV